MQDTSRTSCASEAARSSASREKTSETVPRSRSVRRLNAARSRLTALGSSPMTFPQYGTGAPAGSAPLLSSPMSLIVPLPKMNGRKFWTAFLCASRRNVSSPWKQRAATKPLQLSIASRVGLRVPKTLFTSDPAEALAFGGRYRRGDCHKAMTAPSNQFVDTRVWSSADAQIIGDLPLCPTIFQQQILGPADVRATIVGPQIFSASISTGSGGACGFPSIPTPSVARMSFPAM